MKNKYRLMLLLLTCVCLVLMLNAAASPVIYGVLDRITENGEAVILLEDRKEEWVIEMNELPEASKEGVWFQMIEEKGDYTIVSIDWMKTENVKRETGQLMDRLRAK